METSLPRLSHSSKSPRNCVFPVRIPLPGFPVASITAKRVTLQVGVRFECLELTSCYIGSDMGKRGRNVLREIEKQ